MKKAYMQIAAAGVLWGMLSLFFKVLSAAGLTAPQAVGVRTTVAALAIWGYLLVRDRAALRLKSLTHLWYFVGTGMVSLAFFNSCYFACIDRASIAVAALLLYTAPAFVLLFSVLLFGERLTGRKLAALALAVIGCGLATGVCSGQLSLRPAALLLGLGSGVGYALYTIFGKYALRDYGSSTITAYTMLFAAIGVAPLAQPAQAAAIVCASPANLLAALAGGVLCTVAPYLLYTRGLTAVDGSRASILASIEPVVAALVGILLFHERLDAAKAAGMALVLGAIVLLNRPERAPAPTQSI